MLALALCDFDGDSEALADSLTLALTDSDFDSDTEADGLRLAETEADRLGDFAPVASIVTALTVTQACFAKAVVFSRTS